MFSTKFIQGLTTIALMAIGISGFAQTKVVVIPLGGDDVPIVPTSKTIFVTSQSFNGDLGGISGADDKCQTEANNANPPVPGIFKAWLSTDITENIPDRPSFIKHDLPYNNVNGDNVAVNFDDFLDGIFIDSIDVINVPNGPAVFAWTGTTDSGDISSPTCADWTEGNDPTRGFIGFSDGGFRLRGWSGAATLNCFNSARLYCFEQ